MEQPTSVKLDEFMRTARQAIESAGRDMSARLARFSREVNANLEKAAQERRDRS